MNKLAQELNEVLSGTILSDLLSEMGARFFFPKGIVAQTTEAKKHASRFNATVGMAYQDGQPMHLSAIRDFLPGLTPSEIFAYSTTTGELELRNLWHKEMIGKNPDLTGKTISLPLVVSGLTHGLATAADLLVNSGDTVVLPDMHWGNYRLIFEGRHGAKIATFPFFGQSGGFNLSGFQDALQQQTQNNKIIVLLNFPNNPTGYSPTETQANEIVKILNKTADSGKKIAVIADDAYFGLFYEAETYKQSIFSALVSLHPNILAVKIDGATKEELAWGFRIGFMTFAAQGLSQDHYSALEKKVMGLIRSSISNASRVAQTLLLKGIGNGSHASDKLATFRAMQEKYHKVTALLEQESIPPGLSALPFNSGYFMCFKTETIDAEALRKRLLYEDGIGTIAVNEHLLRVAYSYTDISDLEELYRAIIKKSAS